MTKVKRRIESNSEIWAWDGDIQVRAYALSDGSSWTVLFYEEGVLYYQFVYHPKETHCLAFDHSDGQRKIDELTMSPFADF